ncbi:hypothetical protein J5N97_003262 [Dioscorea zingiberensis]|uniref:Uncharacterized protein n=1 Tax=Dioscorea zingiberensis TaxID=325984 RepID=A0A9D5D3X0_9LILI|nr:hypothetical protein J5N97_003262 [Dioscorea zingiberensis]
MISFLCLKLTQFQPLFVSPLVSLALLDFLCNILKGMQNSSVTNGHDGLLDLSFKLVFQKKKRAFFIEDAANRSNLMRMSIECKKSGISINWTSIFLVLTSYRLQEALLFSG